MRIQIAVPNGGVKHTHTHTHTQLNRTRTCICYQGLSHAVHESKLLLYTQAFTNLPDPFHADPVIPSTQIFNINNYKGNGRDGQN